MTFNTSDPTFRDPAGSLVLELGRAVRHIRPESRAEVLAFLATPFYQRAVERGEMSSSVVEEDAGGLRLIHPRVRIVSYPWEWTPAQWLAAAELTLKLGEQALDAGWILKDATPLNILFVGPQPVLVDVLSFDRREPTSAVWLAYAQYVRTFLFPLLSKKMLHWPLELTLFKRDGYEPAEMYAAMRWTQKMSRAALWPITLPALLDKKKAAENAASAPQAKRDPEIALAILKRMLRGLRKRTQNAVPREAASEWAEYMGTLTHYSKDEAEQKRDWVKAVLEELRPEHVLDVGANTGEFSALAASCGAEVVALERDAESAERIANLSRTQKLAIQTIHADLARPTPAVGWENRESSALLPRLEEKFEVVMMLAVIHHLLLLEQIPLAAIMALSERLTARYLIVEWVPATDPMFVSLMRGRDDLYGSLSEADLMAACEGRFRVVQRQGLNNGRVLFLFERQIGASTDGA